MNYINSHIIKALKFVYDYLRIGYTLYPKDAGVDEAMRFLLAKGKLVDIDRDRAHFVTDKGTFKVWVSGSASAHCAWCCDDTAFSNDIWEKKQPYRLTRMEFTRQVEAFKRANKPSNRIITKITNTKGI